MQIEVLLKAIVPLSLLAIWALTALFNREGKPLPNRVGGPSANPYGPNPGSAVGSGVTSRPLRPAPPPGRPSPAPRPATLPNSVAPSSVNRPPTLRWGPPGSGVSGGGTSRTVGNDDDIVIIETSPGRPGSSSDCPSPGVGTYSGQGRGVGPARRSKPKAVAGPPRPTRSSEETSTPDRGLSGVSQSVNQQLSASSMTVQPLSVQSIASSVVVVGDASGRLDHGPSPARSVIAALHDPIRVKEAILINEILSPPVSMRKRSGSGRPAPIEIPSLDRDGKTDLGLG